MSVAGHYGNCLVPILTRFYSYSFYCYINQNSTWNGNLWSVLKVDNANIIHMKIGDIPPSGLGDVNLSKTMSFIAPEIRCITMRKM